MVKKIDILLDYMRSNEWDKALSLASKWPRLGPQKDDIQTGHDANTNRDFYRQIKKDPDALFEKGIDALKIRYGHLL